MPTALLDTNAVSDLMRGDPQLKAHVASRSDTIATSAIVVGEIEYGLSRLPLGKKRSNLEELARSILNALQIQGITDAIGITYGRLKASLELSGSNWDDNDLWIAAAAMTNGCRLVTRDEKFRQVAGLSVEDWSV